MFELFKSTEDIISHVGFHVTFSNQFISNFIRLNIQSSKMESKIVFENARNQLLEAKKYEIKMILRRTPRSLEKFYLLLFPIT